MYKFRVNSPDMGIMWTCIAEKNVIFNGGGGVGQVVIVGVGNADPLYARGHRHSIWTL